MLFGVISTYLQNKTLEQAYHEGIRLQAVKINIYYMYDWIMNHLDEYHLIQNFKFST